MTQRQFANHKRVGCDLPVIEEKRELIVTAT